MGEVSLEHLLGWLDELINPHILHGMDVAVYYGVQRVRLPDHCTRDKVYKESSLYLQLNSLNIAQSSPSNSVLQTLYS